MYKFIGANRVEYGPVTAEQLRVWIAEGRADANTQARLVGESAWRPLREFPEFAACFSSIPTPPSGAHPPFAPGDPRMDALNQANGPAIGLMILGGIDIAQSVLGLLVDLGVVSWGLSNRMNLGQAGGVPQWVLGMSGLIAGIVRLFQLSVGIYLIYGGQKMKKLESRSACLTAGVLAVLPCLSPCCFIGIPVGIWALVILNQPAVKEQFH